MLKLVVFDRRSENRVRYVNDDARVFGLSISEVNDSVWGAQVCSTSIVRWAMRRRANRRKAMLYECITPVLWKTVQCLIRRYSVESRSNSRFVSSISHHIARNILNIRLICCCCVCICQIGVGRVIRGWYCLCARARFDSISSVQRLVHTMCG